MMVKRKKLAIAYSLAVLAISLGLVYIGVQRYRADELGPPEAPKITWTGLGDDATCGGQAGSGNWWSCALNWSTEVIPTDGDHVIFDSTSNKNANIDPSFSGTVYSITIYGNYAGVITQQHDLNIVHDFEQNGASFSSDPTYQFNVGGSFFVADNQVSNGSVNAVSSDSLGNIYIGGSFTSINSLPISYFAKFDGKKWSNLNVEFDNIVNTIAVDSQNKVYVGGNFIKVGNLTVNGIAKWDGNNWSALDSGVSDGYGGTPTAATVKVLVIDSLDRLYIGGTFENAGSIGRVNHIARWTGNNWEKIGHGVGSTVTTASDGNSYLGGYVNQIIIEDNPDPSATDKDIYIGGSFINICGNDLCSSDNTTGNHLIKFDGKAGTLSSLGGMKSAVNAMIFDAANRLTIYSGSGITSTSGATCSIGYLDGGNWFCHPSYGGSINQFININGVVYAGGTNNWPGSLTNFNEAIKGAPNYNYYASSVPLGNGVDGTVYGLANIGGVLYAYGSFTGGIVKYNPFEPNRAKQLISPFSRSVFTRYTGVGTSVSPYQISDIYGLQAAKLAPDKYYALSGNINADSTDQWNDGSGFLPIGNQMVSFSGNFNGVNHAVNGLTIAGVDQNAGLFGYVDKSGIVSNLSIMEANLSSIKSVKAVGILAGKNLGLISNINVSGTININAPAINPGQSVGGVVGYNSNLNYGTRASQTGVAAYNPNMSYAVNDKVLSGRVYVAIKDSIGVSVDDTTYWRATGDVEINSISNVTANVVITGSNISDVGGILGTQEKIPVKMGGYPYLYETSRIFEVLSGLNTSGSINIANSRGNIGGIIGKQDYEYATIKDSISTMGISLTNDDGSGITGGSTENVGGIAGLSFGPILTSHTSGDYTFSISAQNIDLNNIGGLVGKISNPSSRNYILASSYSQVNININGLNGAIFGVGGLAGDSKIGPVDDCHGEGNLSISSSGEVRNVGGLIGSVFQSNISNSYSSNILSIDNHLASNQLNSGSFGGLVGSAIESNVLLSKSSTSQNINADASCLNTGGVGGLIGNFGGGSSYIISRAYSSGNAVANCTGVGGLVGQLAGNIDQSFATGSSQGSSKVGGLIGYIIGQNDLVSNSFALGNVTTTGASGAGSYGGGFVGLARNVQIISSYSLGKVTGNGTNGGFAGAYDKRDADFGQNYYLKDTNYNNSLYDIGAELVAGEQSDDVNHNIDLTSKITANSKSNLRLQASFINWDFNNIWGINNAISYPYLKAFTSLSPVTSTVVASGISAASTTLNGEIQIVNTYKPYLHGFLYGVDTGNPNVIIVDTDDGNWNGNFNTGNFSADVTNLPPGNYSFRAFSSSLGGTSFGTWQQFVINGQAHKTGDINGDGKIDEYDFTLLLYNWGPNPGNHFADINTDGKVDDPDFTILLYWWGK